MYVLCSYGMADDVYIVCALCMYCIRIVCALCMYCIRIVCALCMYGMADEDKLIIS